jgi:hypothetical protein
MRNLTATCLIEQLDSIYEYFGFNKQVVTDNGPPFGSYEFKEYCKKKNIELIHTPPYHPASNGIVERAVQSVKKALRKLLFEAENSNCSFSLEKSLRNFLRNQRNLPTTSEGWIPAHRLLAYKPRWEMDAIHIRQGVQQQQSTNRAVKKRVGFNVNRDSNVPEKKILDLKKGDDVWFLSTHQGKLYRYEAKVVQRLTKHLYKICMNGNERTVHVNQIQKRFVRPQRKYILNDNVNNNCNESINPQNKKKKRHLSESVEGEIVMGNRLKESFRPRTQSEIIDGEPLVRRSARDKKPPNRLVVT